MKIIAKTDNGFMCTVTSNEVKSLLGLNDTRKDDIEKNIKIGTELTFTTALSNLNLLKDVRLSGSYKTLNKLQDSINELNGVLNVIKGCETPLVEIQKDISEAIS